MLYRKVALLRMNARHVPTTTVLPGDVCCASTVRGAGTSKRRAFGFERGRSKLERGRSATVYCFGENPEYKLMGVFMLHGYLSPYAKQHVSSKYGNHFRSRDIQYHSQMNARCRSILKIENKSKCFYPSINCTLLDVVLIKHFQLFKV